MAATSDAPLAEPRLHSPHAPGATLYDPAVLLIAGALMTLGVAMVYSATVTLAGAGLDWRQWWKTPLRQCVFALASFVGMLVVAHCGYRWLTWERRWRDVGRAGVLYLLSVALLVAVLFIGIRVLGARRAIVVMTSPFTLGFQPAELAKVVLVIWLAAVLARLRSGDGTGPGAQQGDRGIRRLLPGFLLTIASAGVLIALVGLEDFGTAALMGVVTLAMLALAGARYRHLAGAGVVGLGLGALLIRLRPRRLERLLEWLFQAPDPEARTQISQSLLAIGSGGWLGRGLGAGVQKYGYLPQKDSDFILAILCEELGILGGLVVVALFLLLLWRGWRLSRRADNEFGRLLAAGITTLICLQAAFNIGVVTNSVPTKGISLPFVSAGGSGIVFLGLAAGLLASVGRSRAKPAQE